MPSFLIVHSAVADGRIDDFQHPPVLDIGGLRAPLDWGDITLHVPAGDLPVTISVTRADGVIEGARITVRNPAGTGTRLMFVPPARPDARAQLRIEHRPLQRSLGHPLSMDTREARAHIDQLSQKYVGSDYGNPIQSERVILKVAPKT